MGRLSGIRVQLPGYLHIDNLRLPEDGRMTLGQLGYLVNVRVLDRHALGFDFVPTTEGGEHLGRLLRKGGAKIEAVFPRTFGPGQTIKSLTLRITYDPVLATAEDRLIIDPFAFA